MDNILMNLLGYGQILTMGFIAGMQIFCVAGFLKFKGLAYCYTRDATLFRALCWDFFQGFLPQRLKLNAALLEVVFLVVEFSFLTRFAPDSSFSLFYQSGWEGLGFLALTVVAADSISKYYFENDHRYDDEGNDLYIS